MALSVGNNNVAGMSVGTDEVASAYWGDSDVYAPYNSCKVIGLGNENPSTVIFKETGTMNYDFEEITDENNNVFIKIPTFYRKIEKVEDGQITSFSISDTQPNSNFQPYPCFIYNNTVLPYILIGKYLSTSTSTMNSISGTPATAYLNSWRSLAQSFGAGWQVYDWQINKLIQDIFLCSTKRVKFVSSGSISTYLKITGLKEDIALDGVGANITKLYFCYEPDKYINNPSANSDGYYQASYDISSSTTSNRFVSKLGYDPTHTFVNFQTSVQSSSSKYYCNNYTGDNNKACVCWICFGYNSTRGLWYGFYNRNWGNQYSNTAQRLCYRPIEG